MPRYITPMDKGQSTLKKTDSSKGKNRDKISEHWWWPTCSCDNPFDVKLFLENIKYICICIFNNFSTLGWHWQLKLFVMEDKGLTILLRHLRDASRRSRLHIWSWSWSWSRYHSFWWPGDAGAFSTCLPSLVGEYAVESRLYLCGELQPPKLPLELRL